MGSKFLVSGVPVISSLSDAVQFASVLNQWEMITQSLYDSASYVAAGQTQLTFFALPQGQGTGFGGGSKTPSDTNMQLAGQLSQNNAFIISAITIEVQPTTPRVTAQNPAVFGAQAVAAIVNDAYFIRTTGNFQLSINNKPYLLEAPLMQFPAINDFEVNAALSDATTPGSSFQSRIAYAKARSYNPLIAGGYSLAPNNILLTPNQAFSVTLNWPEGLQTITNPARIFVRLNGMQLRAAQ